MTTGPSPRFTRLNTLTLALLAATASAAQAAESADAAAARIEALQKQVNEQNARIEALRREMLSNQRGRGDAPDGAAPAAAGTAPPAPVGQAREGEGNAPAVAQIFEQPGVLTPKGKGVLEPSLQYSYSSSNRIALVGYTVIPAILIGVVDVREVKRNTFNATLTGRFGITNRFELEARVPYVNRYDTSIGRQVDPTGATGSAVNSAFEAHGDGIGDVELTARYQFNDGGTDKPFYVGSLRLKSRTGKDPFQVETDRTIGGLTDGVQTSLPTGSGFYGIQPALTVLFPSDPAVFFGTVSYLYSLKRSDVSRQVENGATESLGTIQPGGVFGFNFGMGLGLNEKSSFSIGYDHASVGKTKQNGAASQDSVRVELGTLLLGYSYRLNSERSLNVSLGAGLTRDTPDVTLTVRMPISF